jgi:hypothetical protein
LVSATVPEIIYTIPPQNPLYYTTFVHVYDAYPNYVDEGYTPGYTGTYIAGPTVVYGSGYDYPAWAGNVYFPEPETWGFDADYDPYTGFWGYDDDFYGGFGGWFGSPWGYGGWLSDHQGEAWGGHRWWGEGGYLNSRDIRSRFGEASQYSGTRGDGRGGDLAARLPGQVPHGAGWHNLYSRQGNSSRNMDVRQTNAFRQANLRRGEANNLYSGRNGDVYRRTDSGWMQRSGEPGQEQRWSGYDRVPEAGSGFQNMRSFGGGYGRNDAGLERDFGARVRGFSRSSSFHSAGGGFHGGGGGGFHGGGGHR